MPKLNLSRVYEAMFLVDSGDAASWDDLVKHLANILTRNGAEIVGITRWDERKLAYTVAKRKRGTYVLAFFDLKNGLAVVEIERDCSLSEKVLRTLLLKADHFSVADMRLQLGEDIRQDVAQRLMTERGETAAVVHAVVSKPTHTGGEPVLPEPSGDYEPRHERGRRSERY